LWASNKQKENQKESWKKKKKENASLLARLGSSMNDTEEEPIFLPATPVDMKEFEGLPLSRLHSLPIHRHRHRLPQHRS